MVYNEENPTKKKALHAATIKINRIQGQYL